jgi:hypothetical protein
MGSGKPRRGSPSIRPPVGRSCKRGAAVTMNAGKTGLIHRDGEERLGRTRPQESGTEESWSVTIRPYRPRSNEELLQDLSTDNSGCRAD